MRGDKKWYGGIMNSILGYKIAVISLVIVILILAFTIMDLSRRTVNTVVIDKSTGRSFFAENKPSVNVYENMLIHDSRNFISALHSVDFETMERDRRDALFRLAPELRRKYQNDIYNKTAIENVRNSRVSSDVAFTITPQIVDFRYPTAKVYAQFEIISRKGGNIVKRDSRHMTVNLRFLSSQPDRPSGLWVTGFDYINADDKTQLNEIINKIGG